MHSVNSPLVSVITPFYNAHEHLRETVESVLAQDYPNCELIIVNDGSNKPTIAEVLHGLEMSKITILNHEENKGLSAARNTACNAAKGELIVPLDADDLISPDFLTVTVEALKNNPDYSAVYTQVRIFGDFDMEWCPDATMLNLMCGIPIQSTVLFKRGVYDTVGGFSTTIKRSPDVDFWLRTLSMGFKLLRVEKPLYYYRKYSGSLSDSGKLTEVEDLAGANPELFLQNLDAIFSLEDDKFQKLLAETVMLKAGFNQMFEGYTNLIERFREVEIQLAKKRKSGEKIEHFYEKSSKLITAFKASHEIQLGKPQAEDRQSDLWKQKLSGFEKEYFKAKLTYATIQEEFKILEKHYLELHEMFDQAVEKLQKLGVRYQISKLLGLPRGGKKGVIK